MHQPEFILVTGSNASGKTTLIEKNRVELEKNGFDLIIPDNILKKRTAYTRATQ
jgi:predicted ABC-type ATPase